MSNRLKIILGAIAVVLIIVWSSVFTVREDKQALVLMFGEIQREIREPGLYFKIPLIQRVQELEDRLLRLDLDDLTVQVSGGKFYEVDAFLTYKIADPRRFRREVAGASLARAESLLRTRFDAALRQTYGRRGFEAALSEERSAMMREVAEQLRPAAERLGLRIADVRIRRTDLTQQVSAQTYERMKAERFAEAERLRARGEEAARRIRAAANRQVVEIRAAAQREAEVLRGEGEGERNRIFAEAVSRDPQFYDFVRSLAAYRKALQDGSTSMVLSPDSEFFRYETFARRFGETRAPSTGPTATGASDGAATDAPAATAPEGGTSGSDEDATDGDTTTTVVPVQPTAPAPSAPATDGTAPADQ